MDHDGSFDGENRSYIMTLKSPRKRNHEELFLMIRKIPGVAYLEEL